MKIQTLNSLPENEQLNFKLVLEAASICLKGRIAYSALRSDNQIVSGVQFIGFSARDHGLLRKYLATLQGDQDHGPCCLQAK